MMQKKLEFRPPPDELLAAFQKMPQRYCLLRKAKTTDPAAHFEGRLNWLEPLKIEKRLLKSKKVSRRWAYYKSKSELSHEPTVKALFD
jgi:hypothetical protein